MVLLSSWMWVLPFCSLYSPIFFLRGVLWFIYDGRGFIKLYIFLGDGCQLWFLWVCCDLVIAIDSGKEKCFCFDALGTKIWDSLLGPATTFTCVLKVEHACN